MIYLKKQNCAINGEGHFLAVQYCGSYPYEIAIRFAGCNLECGACFAAGYSHMSRNPYNRSDVELIQSTDLLIDEFNDLPDKNYNWFRVLGGEPFLFPDRIDFIFNLICELAGIKSDKFSKGIIIQTNGIKMFGENLNRFQNKYSDFNRRYPDIKVVIELSIKGTNVNEFSWITRMNDNVRFRNNAGLNNNANLEVLYNRNVGCYFEVRNLNLTNLRILPAAGFGINQSILRGEYDGLTYDRIFSIINPDGSVTYHPDNWDESFKRLYGEYINDYRDLDPLFLKMPMEGIWDDPNSGAADFAIREARINYGTNFYDSGNGINNDIENKINDLTNYFAFTDLQTYYKTILNS